MSNNSNSSWVSIFWDIENCPPPTGMSGTATVKRLQESLEALGPIKQVFAYAELISFPEKLRVELQRSGVHLIDTPHDQQDKDVADHMIITDMFILVSDNPGPHKIVLIAGDKDYAYTIAKLRLRHHEVILIIPPVGANPILREQADKILEWSVVMTPEETVREEVAFRYDPLLSALEDLRRAGNTLPTLAQLEEHLDSKYPEWRKTSGYESVLDYTNGAKVENWVGFDESEGTVRVFETDTEPEEPATTEDVEGDRYEPLMRVLEAAEDKGKTEVELAYTAIELRKLLGNPLERLQVRQLKEYVLEAEEKGLVRVRRDGLQYYVSRKAAAAKEVPAVDEVDNILKLLLQALGSLKADELMPTAKTLIGRMRELRPGWNLYSSACRDIPTLLRLARERKGVLVEGDPVNPLVFPKSGRFAYVDPWNESDTFTSQEWTVLLRYLIQNHHIQAKGRYGFARLLRESVPEFQKMNIGQLAHMVQLAISKGWLEVYGSSLRVGPQLPESDRQMNPNNRPR